MGRIHIINRAKAYIAKCEPCISGQGGHDRLYKVCNKLLHGLKLTDDETRQLLYEDYNPRCEPPWSLAEIEHKIKDAREKGSCEDLLSQEPPKKAAPGPPPPKTASSTGPTIITATALLAKQHQDMKWAVSGLLPEGAAILAGRPKAGKSWLTMQLAITVANGGKALDKYLTYQGDVLYLALEDGERRLKNRLKKQLGGVENHPALDRIHLACDWPKHGKGGIDALEAFAVQHPTTRLIVIDTLARVRDKRNGTAGLYEEDYEAISRVKSIADKHGVCIIINTHTRKAPAEHPQDEVSGTLGLTGAADAVLVLKRPAHGNAAKLYVSGRDIEEQELNLVFDPQNYLWFMDQTPQDPIGQDRHAVLAVLKEQGKPMGCIDLCGKLKKTPEATAQLLGRMVKEGLLKKSGYGKYEPAEETPTTFPD